MIDLSSLLLNLSGLDESAKKAEGWRWYQQLYLSDPEKPHIGILPLHDAEKVIFHDRTFDHAFYKSSNYRLYPKRKDAIDATRLARVRWIGPLIAGEVADSSCYEVVALNGRPGVPNRVYIAHQFSYLVFLEPRANSVAVQWRFSSAFPSSPEYIRTRVNIGTWLWSSPK